MQKIIQIIALAMLFAFPASAASTTDSVVASSAKHFFAGAKPVSETTLSEVSGTAQWRLTFGDTVEITEAAVASDQRWQNGILRTQMDVWWGTQGSQLIANAVRDSSAIR